MSGLVGWENGLFTAYDVGVGVDNDTGRPCVVFNDGFLGPSTWFFPQSTTYEMVHEMDESVSTTGDVMKLWLLIKRSLLSSD